MIESQETINSQCILGTYEAQTSHIEDAPPLCVQLMIGDTQYVIMSVADGMGGSGRYKVRKRDQSAMELRSMAHIAARQARASVVSCLSQFCIPNQPTEMHARALSTQLSKDFPPLVDEYVFGNGTSCRNDTSVPWLMGATPFPTTVATMIVEQKKREPTVIHMLWGGDSPISILTPNYYYTTLAGPDMDNQYAPDSEIPQDYLLRYDTITLPHSASFMAVATTDGLTSFEPPMGYGFVNHKRAVLDYYKAYLYRMAQLAESNRSLGEAMRMVIDPLRDYKRPGYYDETYLCSDDVTASGVLYDPDKVFAMHDNNCPVIALNHMIGIT